MSDKQLRQLIIDALNFEPRVDAAHIGVVVEDGVATLTGHVGSFAERIAVEQVVRGVRGVQAVAEEIEIRYPEDKKVHDDEIARRCLDILAWNAIVPDAVKVKVEKGWVYLTGVVDWHFQREAAAAAVRRLSGVLGVSNQIGIHETAKAPDIQRKIEDALKRNAEIEAKAIRVRVDGGDKVILEGTVRAWYERRLAERAAWSIPGVKVVDDRLSVG